MKTEFIYGFHDVVTFMRGHRSDGRSQIDCDTRLRGRDPRVSGMKVRIFSIARWTGHNRGRNRS